MNTIKLPVRVVTIDDGTDEWLCLVDADDNRLAPHDIAAALNAAPKPPQWQPIETAPRDGREVLLTVERRAGESNKTLVGHYMHGGHCIDDHPPIAAGWYFWDGCMFDRAAKPTHWMPLPAAP